MPKKSPKKNPSITKDALTQVIGGILSRSDQELFACTREQLEKYWHYAYDPKLPPDYNIYCFHRSLTLYGNFCRRWEEHHHGICCVVERVRDTYLLPKIKGFLAELKTNS